MRCDLSDHFQGSPAQRFRNLARLRRELLGITEKPLEKKYDLVVVGGGYSGMGAAISAARMGCKVALIQDRGVLGGNGSSEVRVWAKGNIRRGKFPRIGEIIEEIADKAKKSPGTYEEFEDAKKEAIVRAEKNIDLQLFHHAFKVEKQGNKISAVHAFNGTKWAGNPIFRSAFRGCDRSRNNWLPGWSGSYHDRKRPDGNE